MDKDVYQRQEKNITWCVCNAYIFAVIYCVGRLWINYAPNVGLGVPEGKLVCTDKNTNIVLFQRIVCIFFTIFIM